MPITRAYAQAAEPGNFFVAGKNKIINGDFAINQRAFSSTTTSDAYGFDRIKCLMNDGTVTYSAQTFTVGTAPVAGYEARNFGRIVTTGQTSSSAYGIFLTNVEDVRTLAGQTATVSFWAKASSGTPKVAVEIQQNFGAGGSPSADVQTYGGQVTLSTSWARYSVTVAIPSISGKTIGTTAPGRLDVYLWVSAGSTFNSRTGTLGIQSNTFDFWGLQLEPGAVATPFTTASGTLAGELAACQRYLPATTGIEYFGYAYNSGSQVLSVNFTVPARVAPTGITTSGTFTLFNSANSSSSVTPTFNSGGQYNGTFTTTGTATSGTPCRVQFGSNTSILWTGCEL